MGKKIRFDGDFLRTLLDRRRGGIGDFAKDFSEKKVPITKAGVHLWMIGRMPRGESLVLLAEYFKLPVRRFLIRKD